MTNMNAKLEFFQQRVHNSANDLRQHLNFLEDASLSLKFKPRQEAYNYLTQLDQAQAIFNTLRADGGPDLRAEIVQFDTVKTRLFRDAGPILATLGGSAKLSAARPQTANQDDHPWWFLDSYVAEQRAKQSKQMLQGGLIIAAVIGVITLLMNTVFKPDPIVVAVKQHYDVALGDLTMDQDYEAALAEIDLALAVKADDPSSLVLKGVILEMMEDLQAADEIYAQAIEIVNSEEIIMLERGRLLLQLNEFERSLALAEQAIALNPESANAWFLSGQSYERLGDIGRAYEDMNKAADFALAQGDDTLYAIIKVNIGYLSPGIGSGGL